MPDGLDRKARAAVREGVDRLPDDERRAVYLKFWQDCTSEETARALRVSTEEAEGILNGALAKLRREFESTDHFGHLHENSKKTKENLWAKNR